MSHELDDLGRQLLQWLIAKLQTFDVNNQRTFVSYRDALDDLGLETFAKTDGLSLRKQGLDTLANWVAATNKPAITGLIVERDTLLPGDGYFKAYGRPAPDIQWWLEQIQLSKELDWLPFLASNTDPAVAVLPPTPEASDLQPPDRIETTTYRVLRDTDVAKEVKRLHAHQCQICGLAIILPDGRPYAEAHHIQPLGGEHKGHDVLENLLCVCPNHHVELDYALWDIEIEKLRTVPGHMIGAEYVLHHNTVVRNRWVK
jgi:hypothetical protein